MKYYTILQCKKCGETIGLTEEEETMLFSVFQDGLPATDKVNFFNCRCKREGKQQDFIARDVDYARGAFRPTNIRPLDKEEKDKLLIWSL